MLRKLNVHPPGQPTRCSRLPSTNSLILTDIYLARDRRPRLDIGFRGTRT
jgi:hypothetical protein